jgi:hypothetical protein
MAAKKKKSSLDAMGDFLMGFEDEPEEVEQAEAEAEEESPGF